MSTGASSCVMENPRNGKQRFPSTNKRVPQSDAAQNTNVVDISPASSSQPLRREFELIRQAIGGDYAALETLFTAGRPRLHRVAASVLGNAEDAEDAVQEGLLSAFRNLQRFQGRSRFSTWLTRIVLNAARMSRRRKKRHPALSLEDCNPKHDLLSELQVVDTRPTPEHAFFVQEKDQLIDSSVGELSPLLQSAFRLRHFHFMSTREAARFLGTDVKVVKSRSWRARQKLAKVLPERLAGRS